MSLRAEQVRWSQHGTLIVDGIDVRIASGEFLGLLGPNGSGKSSLLRLLAGIRAPDTDRMLLDEEELSRLSNRGRARRIALVEQENTSDADMSVLEVALLGRSPHRGPFDGVSEAERGLARRALEVVGLGALADREWSSLSGGERQRTVIARALTQQPTELLLDEFTNHLEVKHQLRILELLSRSPSTVVAALHDLNLAVSYCDRILLLDGGRVVAAGTPAEVITAERLAAVYGVMARIDHDEAGIPAVRFVREPHSCSSSGGCGQWVVGWGVRVSGSVWVITLVSSARRSSWPMLMPPLFETGRLRLVRLVVDSWWSLRCAAERFSCLSVMAKKWADRYRVVGPAGMRDLLSRLLFLPRCTSCSTGRRIVVLCFTGRWGSHRIGWHLYLSGSIVGNVLRRYRMLFLSHIDKATGLSVRRPKPVCYEHEHSGDLVHVEIKKLGCIPDGGGHWVMGPQQGQSNRKSTRPGYAFLYHVVEDHWRLVYSEILGDQRKETVAVFWERARAFFAEYGITVLCVITDNGSCYRSHAFHDALDGSVKHKFTHPYRPQTNRKIEKFNRTLTTEWAYAHPYQSESKHATTNQA